MKMKRRLVLMLLLIIGSNTFAQETMLTKKQMYKDFDQLVKIIEDCNVQLPVRKAVTGYDNLAEIKKLRKQLDTVTCNWGFQSIIGYALRNVMDDHSVRTGDYYAGYENLDGIDTNYLNMENEKRMERMQKEYEKQIERLRSKEPIEDVIQTDFPIPITYYKNGYYIIGQSKYISKDKRDTLDIHFMKILSYNGQDIHQYAKENNFATRWDYNNKSFYLTRLYLPNQGILKVEDHNKVYEINIDNYNTNTPGWGSAGTRSVKLEGVPELKDGISYNARKEVEFFEKDSILFVFLQSMMDDDTSFYDKIKEVGKGKVIKKIVIDVRGNRGGDDYVWHNTLKAIIKDSIPFDIKLAYNDTKIMRNKLKEHDKATTTEKISWLGNKKYRIISDNDCLVADSNSLQYEGKIYILYNGATFSAAHSLVTYAEYLDQLVSVGYSTGKMVGFGLMPSLFQLRYSKFTFRLACTMDVTNCTKPIDVYHDFPEIEVNPTIEEDLVCPMSIYDTKSIEFLYKYDTWFKKVLELE